MKNDIERLLEGKEAVIFDVDGTLIDSMGVWEEVDRIYLTRHGKPMSEDLQRKLAGLSFLQAADYFRNVIGIDDPPEKMLAEWNELAFEQYRHEIQREPQSGCHSLKRKNCPWQLQPAIQGSLP